MISEKGQTFLEAWKEHEEIAARISLTSELERTNGHPWRPPTMALKHETDRMVNALGEYADELLINPVHLLKALQELRREGMDFADILESISTFLYRARIGG